MLRLAKAGIRVRGLGGDESLMSGGGYPGFGLESFAFQPDYQVAQIPLQGLREFAIRRADGHLDLAGPLGQIDIHACGFAGRQLQ